jgi:hypothetical protein
MSQMGSTDDHTIIYTVDRVTNGFCYCFSDPKKLKATNLPCFKTKDFSPESLDAKTSD